MAEQGEEKPLLHKQIITPYNINSISIAHSTNYTVCNIYNINDKTINNTVYKLYRSRWWILFLFSLLSAQQSVLWITYGAVADTSEEYYHKSAAQINFLASLGPIAFIPFATLSSWLMGEYGLRKSCVGAAILCAVAAVIRCFATGKTFWIVIIAQFLNAATGPIVMSGPPALSAAWFGINERTFATAVASLANYIGTALGFLFGLFINDTSQLIYLLYAEAIISMIILIGFLIHFPDAPPTAPSATASVKKPRLSFEKSVMTLLKDVATVMTQKDALILVLVGGLTPGVYGGWGAMIVSLLGPLGYNQLQAQWLAFASTMIGLVAGLTVGYVHDRFRHFKILMVAFFFVGSITFAVFSLATSGHMHLPFFALLMVSAMGGCIINALYPIAFEALVEVTYPIKEEVSVSMNTLLNNVACLLFLIVGTYINPQWMNWIVVATCASCTVATLFVKEEYKRSTIDLGGKS